MKKISAALEDIIKNNAFLQLGLSRGLLNLAQTAKFIQPLIAARTKKEVQTSAITMALSRYQRSMKDQSLPKDQKFSIDSLSVQSDLAVLSLRRSSEAHKAVTQIYARIASTEGYITVTEGQTEITVIYEQSFSEVVNKILPSNTIYRKSKLTALCIRFNKKYLATPGYLFSIIQAIVFQGINIVELASSSTEFIVYLDSADARLAFDTLYQRFCL